MPRLALTCLVAATLAAAPALAGNESFFPANPDGTVSFNMPSGNVGCTFIPAGGTAVYYTATGQEELICARIEPQYLVVILEYHLGGQRPILSGEVPELPQGPGLDYGRFWQMGAFTCLAARSGLTCTNSSGAGLRMSRAEVVTW